MTIAIATPLTETEFKRRLKKLLIQLEHSDPAPYADTHNPTHPTIGIGFDLTQPTIRSKVYAAMEITEGSTTATSLTNAILAAQGKTTAAIQTDLDKAYGKPFVMTDAQIDTAFAQIAKPYIDTAKGSGIDYSNELVALTSVAFNGVYGSGLKDALALANSFEARAEAWYQIRVSHVWGQNDKRRIAESALFGLYPPGQAMNEEIARAVCGVYTKHDEQMIDYDAKYGSLVAQANAELVHAGFTGSAKTLEASLKEAADFLITQYGNGQQFSPLNVLVASANTKSIEIGSKNTHPYLLIGDEQSNLLSGASGDDGLYGGLGNDTLSGGAGFDTYLADSGDHISDSDGQGTVKLGTSQLGFATRKAGETEYHDGAGNRYLWNGGTLNRFTSSRSTACSV